MDEQRFQHAIFLRDSGRPEEAAYELRSMIEDSPNAPDMEKGLILLNEAVCLSHGGGSLDKAERLLEEASSLLGEDRGVRALVDSAEASFYMGQDPRKALEKYDLVSRKYADVLRSSEEKGLYRENQLRRGLLLVELKHYRKARAVMEEVLKFDVEKNGEFYFSFGICYLALHENELARQQFGEAIRLGVPEQKLIDCRFYLGVAYFRMQMYAKALHEFESCQSHTSKSKLPLKTLYRWLGLTCQQLSLTEEARRYKDLSAKF